MTIVCACTAGGETWIAGDTRWHCNRFIYPEKGRKLVRCGNWWLGQAGDAHAADLIRRKAAERIAEVEDPYEIGEILTALWKDAGYKAEDDFGPPSYRQEIILARRGEVYEISGNGTVGMPEWGFAAIGSGMPYAYGAAWVLRNNVPPREVVRGACLAAIQFDASCGGEIEPIRVE